MAAELYEPVEMQEALDANVFIDIALPIDERRYQSHVVAALKTAARRVANPDYEKNAIELVDSDGNHQWVVTVLVDGPGDYILLTTEDE